MRGDNRSSPLLGAMASALSASSHASRACVESIREPVGILAIRNGPSITLGADLMVLDKQVAKAMALSRTVLGMRAYIFTAVRTNARP
jgi:hypothetical protein